ncbi:uncharacterized protein LOC130674196 [Microplitis mediator]|uniref:uncharacterized protein LOC130674196 n=1 Tax=Microplitis mediator TaxID=375433 RepID=UPI0025554F8C|nr:uncharacterized protein LOC130674196 [Microplitis mediator]
MMPQLQVNYCVDPLSNSDIGLWNFFLGVLVWITSISGYGRPWRLSRRSMEGLYQFFQRIFDLYNCICVANDPEYRPDIKGMISIDSIYRRRMQRRADRNNWFYQRLLRPADVTEGDDFDFLGIRWMHKGRWGEDHPAADWAHPAWTNLPGLEHFYFLE